MSNKAQVSVANNMLNIIKHEQTINKFDLMDRAGLSVGAYNQISAWFKHRYSETTKLVEYDKKFKMWKWIGDYDSNQQI